MWCLLCCQSWRDFFWVYSKTFHFQQSSKIDFGYAILFTGVMVSFSNLFVYCFFGVWATDSFKTMPEDLYGLNWYELPVKMQKYLIIMITNMQRPLYYHAFGVTALDLETFSKVLSWLFAFLKLKRFFFKSISFFSFMQLVQLIFQYYMVLKTLASD